MNNLLVLLGSGATVPHIPAVSDITDHILDWRYYLEPEETACVEGVAGEVACILPCFGNPERRTLYRFLWDELQQYWNTTQPTFEELIHLTESLATYLPLPPGMGTIDKYRPIAGAFLAQRANFFLPPVFGVVPGCRVPS